MHYRTNVIIQTYANTNHDFDHEYPQEIVWKWWILESKRRYQQKLMRTNKLLLNFGCTVCDYIYNKQFKNKLDQQKGFLQIFNYLDRTIKVKRLPRIPKIIKLDPHFSPTSCHTLLVLLSIMYYIFLLPFSKKI